METCLTPIEINVQYFEHHKSWKLEKRVLWKALKMISFLENPNRISLRDLRSRDFRLFEYTFLVKLDQIVRNGYSKSLKVAKKLLETSKKRPIYWLLVSNLQFRTTVIFVVKDTVRSLEKSKNLVLSFIKRFGLNYSIGI